MGNINSSENNKRILNEIENIKNVEVKEKETSQNYKKRSVFYGLTWKRLVETTRRNRNSKSQKVKPHEETSVSKNEVKAGQKEIFYINENFSSDNKRNCNRRLDQQPSNKLNNNQRAEVKLKSYKSELVPSSKSRKVVIQASTSELLRCLGEYICRRCDTEDIHPNEVVAWIRGVDRNLIAQGWQELKFVMPSSVVFVYMLCRDNIPKDLQSKFQIRCQVHTCLYLAYSYMGNEISYPLRPFIIETDRYNFWERCCRIMNNSSAQMLRINSETHFFTSIFRELTKYSPLPPPVINSKENQ